MKEIARAVFWGDVKLTVPLSVTVSSVDEYAFGGWKYASGVKVSVAENHPIFTVQDGLLLQTTTDGKRVILQLIESEQLTIPQGVTEVTGYVGGEKCKEIVLPSTVKKLTGKLETNKGRIVFNSVNSPVFRENYQMKVKTIVVPKGTAETYKKAIGERYDTEEDSYYIWDDNEIELIEM